MLMKKDLSFFKTLIGRSVHFASADPVSHMKTTDNYGWKRIHSHHLIPGTQNYEMRNINDSGQCFTTVGYGVTHDIPRKNLRLWGIYSLDKNATDVTLCHRV